MLGIDVVMPIYNLTEYSNDYLKTSGSLWQVELGLLLMLALLAIFLSLIITALSLNLNKE